MNQFVKIVRFVTTSVFYVTCVPWNCVGITLFILWWFFLLHENNKYFGNNYGSSFRDVEVTVLTNIKTMNIKTLFAKIWSNLIIKYIKYYFSSQGKILYLNNELIFPTKRCHASYSIRRLATSSISHLMIQIG